MKDEGTNSSWRKRKVFIKVHLFEYRGEIVELGILKAEEKVSIKSWNMSKHMAYLRCLKTEYWSKKLCRL
jgi:hypothetical protein